MYERYWIHISRIHIRGIEFIHNEYGGICKDTVVSTGLTGLACSNSRSYCQKSFWRALGVLFSPGDYLPVSVAGIKWWSRWETNVMLFAWHMPFTWVEVGRQIHNQVLLPQRTGRGGSATNLAVECQTNSRSVLGFVCL